MEKIIHRMGKGCKWVHRKGNQNRKKSFIRILFSPVIGTLHLTTEGTISCQSALKILGCWWECEETAADWSVNG